MTTENDCPHCGTPLLPSGEVDFPRAKTLAEEQEKRRKQIENLLEELRGKEERLAAAEAKRERMKLYWDSAEPGRREWELTQVERQIATLRESVAESDRVLALEGHVVERTAPHEHAEKRPGRALANAERRA
jgi:DNA repair exonuclease SbcCD ATPase subunit